MDYTQPHPPLNVTPSADATTATASATTAAGTSVPSAADTTVPKLIIHLSTEEFAFAITSGEEKREIPYSCYAVDETRSLTANLKRFVREKEWRAHTFREVKVVMASHRFTLMPLELFEDEQAELLFYHNLSPMENEEVKYNILPGSNVVVLFGIDRSAARFLNELWGPVMFYSQAAPIIDHLATMNRQQSRQRLFVNLHANLMEVYAFERGKLLMGNAQECSYTTDRLYYLLSLWKQLQFDPLEEQITLCGKPREVDQLVQLLRRYIRHVETMPASTYLDLSLLMA